MEVVCVTQINIDENKVDNFSDDTCTSRIEKKVAKYVNDLIKKQIW